MSHWAGHSIPNCTKNKEFPTCTKTKDGEVLFQDQRQEPLPAWSILPAFGEDDINEWLDRTFFEGGTEPEACAAQWGAGERMDWQMAVSAFF